MSFHATLAYSRINELEAENARLSSELDIARRLLLDGELLAAKLKGDIASIKHKGLAVLLTLAHDPSAIYALTRKEKTTAGYLARRLLECKEAAEARDLLDL